MPKTPTRRRRLLTTRELAEELRVSIARVRQLRAAGTIPAVGAGPRSYRFDLDEVLKVLTTKAAS